MVKMLKSGRSRRACLGISSPLLMEAGTCLGTLELLPNVPSAFAPRDIHVFWWLICGHLLFLLSSAPMSRFLQSRLMSDKDMKREDLRQGGDGLPRKFIYSSF